MRHMITPKLRVHRLEDRSLPSFGFGSALGVGSTGDDRGTSIVLDAAGSTYVSGSFNNTVEFDPNGTNPNSNHVLTATGGDGFVAKYLSDGTFQWATDFVNGATLELAVQGSNVFVPDTSGAVSRLDAGTGAVLWTATVGTGVNAVAVDPSGSLYADGLSGSQALVTRLDPTSGNLIWTRTSSGGSASALRLGVDGAGNVYATGNFSGTATFGSTSLTTYSTFVWKLNASGSTVWAGSVGSSGGATPYGIATDGGGNAYITGYWLSGSNNFNPGSGKAVTLANHGFADVFIVKLTPGKNGAMQLGWAKDIGGTGTDWGFGIAVDGSGNVYTSGGFIGTVNFNPNNGSSHNLAGGGVFVSKLDANGNYVAAAGMAGTPDGNGEGTARSIALDTAGNVYTTGFFSGTADFDPTSGVYNLTSNGGNDAFVSKLTQSGMGPIGLPPSLAGKNGGSGDILAVSLPSTDADSPIAALQAPGARSAIRPTLVLAAIDSNPIFVGTPKLETTDLRLLSRSRANYIGLLSDENMMRFDVSE